MSKTGGGAGSVYTSDNIATAGGVNQFYFAQH